MPLTGHSMNPLQNKVTFKNIMNTHILVDRNSDVEVGPVWIHQWLQDAEIPLLYGAWHRCPPVTVVLKPGVDVTLSGRFGGWTQ